MLEAKLLNTKPNFNIEQKELKKDKALSIADINIAIESLDLKYKRVDEIDIYNIFQFIKEAKKG